MDYTDHHDFDLTLSVIFEVVADLLTQLVVKVILVATICYLTSSLIFSTSVECDKDNKHVEQQTIGDQEDKDWPYFLQKSKAPQQIPVGLFERMTYYQNLCLGQDYVPSDHTFALRLDGRKFSKYTSQFKKIARVKYNVPYSPEFKRAMLLTAHDLMHEFNACTAYTHSDEITLVFGIGSDVETSQHIFGGRVNKILSCTASYASVRFNFHMAVQMKNVEAVVVLKSDLDYLTTPSKLTDTQTFDCRLIMFPLSKKYEMVNLLMWRSKGDCTRNFISMFAEEHIGKKKLERMNSKVRVEKLVELGFKGFDPTDENVDWSMKYGTFMKRSGHNQPNAEGVVTRSIFKKLATIFYVFKTFTFSDDMVRFLTEHDSNDFIKSEKMMLNSPMIYTDWNCAKLLYDVPDYQKSASEVANKELSKVATV